MTKTRSRKAPRSPLHDAMRSCQPALFASFVISFFINLAMMVMPLYSMQVYDRVLTSRSVTTLVFITLIVLTFLALYGILEYARSGIFVRAGHTFESGLRRPLFDAMMRAELDPAARQGQQVIRDAEAMRDSLSGGVAATIFDLPWLPIFLGLCYLMHPLLGAVALGGAVVLFGLALLAEVLNKSHFERASKLSNDASQFAAAALRNGEAVRGLGMGDTVLDRWTGHQSAASIAHAETHERAALLHALSKFARVAIQTISLCVGAWLAISNEISPGVMMAASIVMGRALAPVEQIVGQWKRIVGARSAYRRLAKLFLDAPAPAEKMSLPAPTGLLEIENLTIAPVGSNKASVRSVSFKLAAGETLAIIGASASGKSSLCRALAGVWPIKGGHIRVDGADIGNWDPNKLGKHVGYLPQDVELFDGTVAENIARLQEVDESKVIEAAKSVGIHELILRLPMGYDTPLGSSGVALAGGVRQRVGLARALYGNPKIVLLDEPNSNLDDDGEKALAKAISRMKADGRTVILVTHRPQILAHVDKLMVMSLGSIVAFGPRDEVLGKVRGNRVAAVEGGKSKAAAAV
jgi:PrtD family type I secretion system ABC transporter